MRLRIFGIPKILLFFLGLLPTLIWCGFHLNSVLADKKILANASAIGGVLAFFFLYFFSRGFFKIRYFILTLSTLVISEVVISSMIQRDFARLVLSLFVFGAGAVCAFWLDRRVHSADINPKLHWFEGDPKLLPRIEGRLKFGDIWQKGHLRSIDRNGFFIFLDASSTLFPKRRLHFELKFRDLHVEGVAKINAYFYGSRPGFGLQFSPKDFYHFSQYTTLVERLKGEGL